MCSWGIAFSSYGYGFDKREHTRAINESEAENVKLIFGRSREGLSARSIAQRLNTRGVPSPAADSGRYCRDETRGASKRASPQVRRILNCEGYTGVTCYDRQRMTERRRTRGRYESGLRPKSEWKLPESHVMVTPQIISKELFDEVQSLLRSRAKGSNQADGDATTCSQNNPPVCRTQKRPPVCQSGKRVGDFPALKSKV